MPARLYPPLVPLQRPHVDTATIDPARDAPASAATRVDTDDQA